MATWRQGVLWMALLVGIVGMALSLILMGTGSISVRQAVRQGLVSSGMVLTVSAVLLDPRHKRLSTRVAGIGILLSSIAIVLFFT